MVMNAFRKNQLQLLVATDVAARGIDVDDVTHVINYQLPDEIEIYTHRSGRTGRAGKSGISMVIIGRSELRKIKAIEKKIKQEFEHKKIPTGMEICEIQLYHLASKIKNTRINKEIDTYLPAIYDVLEGMDREELIKKMVAVEFSRFYTYYSGAKDLNSDDSGNRSPREGTAGRDALPNDGSVRYFINVGEKDGYDWMSLKDFLRNTLELEQNDIQRVDVKESFSFFNSDAALSGHVLSTFTDLKVDGRFVNVEISKNPESGGNRKQKDKGRRKKKDKGRGAAKNRSFSGKKGNKPGGRRSKKRDGFY